jgi:hypothetical protein
MKKYYTLFVYEPDHDKWFNHFGDYDKETVADEMNDLNYGWDGILMKHMRIVKTSDQQTDIDAALDKLNGKVGLS